MTISRLYNIYLANLQDFHEEHENTLTLYSFKNRIVLEYCKFLINETSNLNKATLIISKINL